MDVTPADDEDDDSVRYFHIRWPRRPKPTPPEKPVEIPRTIWTHP